MHPIATLTLDRLLSAPGETRRHFRPVLRSLGVPEQIIDEILLAVSEAVANAVLHGAPAAGSAGPDEVTVRAFLDGTALVVTVTSPGTGWTVIPPTRPDPTAAGGRGLFVIQSLTDAWSVRQGPEGTTVSLTRRLPPRGESRGAPGEPPPAHPSARRASH